MLSAGARLRQYEIVSPLGQGGMGVVYRAHDERLDRDVAIKVLSPQLAGDFEMRERFEREARAIAALSHPNIVTIYEFTASDDIWIAVMELLEGETLRRRLERGPLPWRDAGLLAATVADGLAAAHAKDVVHRDLKPENVFITSEGLVKILDFGLARRTAAPGGAGENETVAATRPGVVLGTLGYMAPEQLRGDAVDGRADIFALGCILHETLTGRRPFEAASDREVAAAILNDTPPPTMTGQRIPPEIIRIARYCLEKDPERRFSSARDVALAVRAALTESAATPAPSRRIAQKRRTRSLAVLPFATDTLDRETEYLTDGITESIINALSQLPKLRVVPRSTVFRYKGREHEPGLVGLSLGADALVTGRVVRQGDLLKIQAELVDTATESQLWGEQYRVKHDEVVGVQEELTWHISEALRIRLSAAEKTRMTKKPTANPDAYQEYVRGRHHWSRWTPEDFRKALVHFERAIEHDPSYARAYSGLGDTYGVLAYFGYIPPAEGYPRARAAAERAVALDPRLADAHVTLAIERLFFRWEFADAERCFRRALELDRHHAAAHAFYGLMHIIVGRPAEALKEARRGQEADPLSTIINVIVAWTLYHTRRFREAIDHAHRMLDLGLGSAVHAVLCAAYERLGEYDRAAAAMQEVAYWIGLPEQAGRRMVEALANDGIPGYWRAKAEMFEPDGAQQFMQGYARAIVDAQRMDLDQAFSRLDDLIAQRAAPVLFAMAEPAFDPLRGDPRFEQVVARIGLPVASLV